MNLCNDAGEAKPVFASGKVGYTSLFAYDVMLRN